MGADEVKKEDLEKRKLALEIARLEKLTDLEERKISAETESVRHALQRQLALAVIGLLVPALSVSTSIYFHMRSQEQQAQSALRQAKSDMAALEAKTASERMLREREMLIQALSLISKEASPAERITGAVALSAAVTPGGLEARIATGALLARLSYEQDLQVVEAISRSISNLGMHAAPEIMEANRRAAISLARNMADWAEMSSRKLTSKQREEFEEIPAREIRWISRSLSPVLERAGLPVQPDQGRRTPGGTAELQVLRSKRLWEAYLSRRDAPQEGEGTTGARKKERPQVDPIIRLNQIEAELIRNARIVAGTSRAVVQILRNSDTSTVTRIDLSDATITRGSLDGRDLSNAKLSGAYVGASIANASLINADLTNALIAGSLAGSDLRGAKLTGAYIPAITPALRFRAKGCREKQSTRMRYPILESIEQQTLAAAYWEQREAARGPLSDGRFSERAFESSQPEQEKALEENKKTFLASIAACTSPETLKSTGNVNPGNIDGPNATRKAP